jgi:hypothetical protein
MHNVSHISLRMQKHKFGTTCPGVLFVEFVPVPPESEKWCDHVSRPERTEMHYVTHKLHRMYKHKLGVTCPGALFMQTVPGPPDHQNALTFPA